MEWVQITAWWCLSCIDFFILDGPNIYNVTGMITVLQCENFFEDVT